jgi:hypothetical protein
LPKAEPPASEPPRNVIERIQSIKDNTELFLSLESREDVGFGFVLDCEFLLEQLRQAASSHTELRERLEKVYAMMEHNQEVKETGCPKCEIYSIIRALDGSK